MASSQGQKQDHWTSQAYTQSAAFVPKLTTTVYTYLSPNPGEKILDLGCGDGPLTSRIASAVLPSGGLVTGLDASASMIETARSSNAAENITYRVQDGTRLAEYLTSYAEEKEAYDKVFSNAALHWILRREETRRAVFEGAYALLRPGGELVFEMGAHGNVPEAMTVLIATLARHGVSLDAARKANPWFFPSETWMRKMLETVGFVVEKVEVEDRPTRLIPKEEGGTGLRGWLELMGAEFLSVIEDEGVRKEALDWAVEVLRDVVTREEDGSQWLMYKRLRAVARKPSA